MRSRWGRLWRVVLAAMVLQLSIVPTTAFGQTGDSLSDLRVAASAAAYPGVYQATCPSPRPPVKVETQALGDGRIQAKVTAGFGVLTLIRFGAMQNAHVE